MYFLPQNDYEMHRTNLPCTLQDQKKTPWLADPSTSSCPLSGNS